jgi:hypothetical protein
MTREQEDSLWRQFEKLHPELVKKADHYEDDSFDDFVAAVEEDSKGIIDSQTRVVEFGADVVTAEPAPPREAREWEEIE